VFGLNPSKGKQPHQQQQPDPRSAHQPAPRPYNSQDVGGCAGTQFGCCPNGVASSNIYGSNCKWPQPYARYGGHHQYWSRTRPTPSPTATSRPMHRARPRPTATSKPSATPSPSATSKPSASPSPSATSKPSASPTASASPTTSSSARS
jgi:hypothetical protein